MKALRCRLGRHDDSISRFVDAHGAFTIMVYEDHICKRCKRLVQTHYRRSIFDFR